jgi:hypothetical protein
MLMHAGLTLQVLAVVDRADAWEAVDFLNMRGGNVKFGKIAAPPSEEEWSKKGQASLHCQRSGVMHHSWLHNLIIHWLSSAVIDSCCQQISRSPSIAWAVAA